MTMTELIEQLRRDLPDIVFREPRGLPSAERAATFLEHYAGTMTRIHDDLARIHQHIEDRQAAPEPPKEDDDD